MTKDNTRSSTSTSARGRVKYAAQACDVCRKRKIRCDGQKPTCEPCLNTGREDECTWHGEPVRRPRTEAHFQAMRSRLDALRDYAVHLESLLQSYKKECNGTWDNSYLTRRPQDVDFTVAGDENESFEPEVNECVDESDPIYQICRSTRGLKLLDGGYLGAVGNTAISRFAPEVLPVTRLPAVRAPSERSYVLVLDGVEETPEILAVDWSRHLPAGHQLTRREHDRLLDLLFRFVTNNCLRIIPPIFLRDMQRELGSPPDQPHTKGTHYSPILHNAALAVACGFSDDPLIHDDSRSLFAAKAKSYIDTDALRPSISLVHALSLLSGYHSIKGEQMLGYLYFGMSARISQALGVGMDCSDWVKGGLISEDDRLDRNWVHWTTVNLDVAWSMYVGREFCVHVPDNLKGIPVPFVDYDFDKQPWSYPESGLPPQSNNLLKTFAATCKLFLIGRRIVDVVNKLNNGPTRAEVLDDIVSSLDLQLNTWKRDLCPDVELSARTRGTATPHRLITHMYYWLLFVLLHRPFYSRQAHPSRRNCSNIDHIKLCKHGAENIMELLTTYHSLYGIRHTTMNMVQIVFTAGTVWLLAAVHAMVGVRMAKEAFKRAYQQAQLCAYYLDEMGRFWKLGADVADILKQLMYEKLKPWIDRGIFGGSREATAEGSSSSAPGERNLVPLGSLRDDEPLAFDPPEASVMPSQSSQGSGSASPIGQVDPNVLQRSTQLANNTPSRPSLQMWYPQQAQHPRIFTSGTSFNQQMISALDSSTLETHSTTVNDQAINTDPMLNGFTSNFSSTDRPYLPYQPPPFDDLDLLFSLPVDGSDNTSNYQSAMRCGMTFIGHPVVPTYSQNTAPYPLSDIYLSSFDVDFKSELSGGPLFGSALIPGAPNSTPLAGFGTNHHTNQLQPSSNGQDLNMHHTMDFNTGEFFA